MGTVIKLDTKRHDYLGTCGTLMTVTSVLHKKIQGGMSYRIHETGGEINAAGYFDTIMPRECRME